MDLQKTAEESGGVVAVYRFEGESASLRSLFPPGAPAEVLQVQDLRRAEQEVAVLYPSSFFSEDGSTWLPVLFGESSLHPGLHWAEAYWPEALLSRLAGPGWGLPGLRKALFLPPQPLLGGIVRMASGYSLADFKRAMIEFGTGGADLLLDDEMMADVPRCPFEARLEAGLEAAREIDRRTGRRVLYAPNIADRPDRMIRKLERVAALKGAAVTLQPFLSGLSSLSLASEFLKGGAAVIARWSFAGPWLKRVSPELVLGDLPRWCGADAVLCPGLEGAGGMDKRELKRVVSRLTRPIRNLRPCCPLVSAPSRPNGVEELVEVLGLGIGFVCGTGGSEHVAGGRACAKQMREAILRAAAAHGAKPGGGFLV